MQQPQLPPGLAGYLTGQQQSQQQGLGQLQQAAQLIGLQGALQAQQRETGFRNALTAAGPNASQDQLAGIAAQYGSPSDVLKTQQSSLDRRAAMELRASEAQARLDMQRQNAEQIHEFRMGRLQADTDRAAETARHNKAMEGLNLQNAQLNADLKRLGLDIQRDKVNAAATQATDKQVQALGTALEKAGLPTSEEVLKQVRDALGPDEQKALDRASYISGTNSWKPDLAVDKDVKDLRQASAKLFNITLKDRSGAAVTNQELERLKQEFATGIWKSPDQFINGIKKAEGIIKQHYAAVAAGFGPDALKGYNDNLRSMGGRVVLEPGGAAPAPQQFREGQTATGPNGQKIIFRGGAWQPAR